MKLTMRDCKVYLENDISSVEIPFMRPSDFREGVSLSREDVNKVMLGAIKRVENRRGSWHL